jgi:hypothetical protein
MTEEVVAQATGRAHREDAVLGDSGGPAGNARLTAWTGLLLLVLFLAEMVTLLGVRGLISWHIAIGVLLIPPALFKTGVTGWRVVRYYSGNRPYQQAGPPPTIMRLLGPLVVLSTLALLGSGLALAIVGPDTSRTALVTVLGQRVDPLTIHQATFLAWGVITGIHALGRLIPAVRTVSLPGLPAALRAPAQAVPGRYRRATALAVTMVAAAVAATIVVAAAGAWRSDANRHFDGPPRAGYHARHH